MKKSKLKGFTIMLIESIMFVTGFCLSSCEHKKKVNNQDVVESTKVDVEEKTSNVPFSMNDEVTLSTNQSTDATVDDVDLSTNHHYGSITYNGHNVIFTNEADQERYRDL